MKGWIALAMLVLYAVGFVFGGTVVYLSFPKG